MDKNKNPPSKERGLGAKYQILKGGLKHLKFVKGNKSFTPNNYKANLMPNFKGHNGYLRGKSMNFLHLSLTFFHGLHKITSLLLLKAMI